MAPHQSRCGVTDEQNGKYISLWQHLKLSLAPTVLSKRFLRTRYGMRSVVYWWLSSSVDIFHVTLKMSSSAHFPGHFTRFVLIHQTTECSSALSKKLTQHACGCSVRKWAARGDSNAWPGSLWNFWEAIKQVCEIYSAVVCKKRYCAILLNINHRNAT